MNSTLSSISDILTGGKTIIDDTDVILNEFQDILNTYGEFVYYDASILKKRMKDMVVRAVTDEL